MRRDDERGSMLISAVMVMMILTTLSLALLTRSLSSMKLIKSSQDFDAALAAADAGLSDALYRIDQSAPDTWSTTGTSGNGTFAYRAERKSVTEYWVSSVGTVGSSKHGIRAKVKRTAKFPFAIFTEQNLTINGNNSGNVYSFNVLGQPTGQAAIGSNHQITINSGKGGGDSQHYFAPYGGCTGCTNPVAHTEGPYGGKGGLPKIRASSVPTGPTQACPALGAFGPVVNGMSGVPFVCSRDVAFVGGPITVTNPPFVLYLVPTASVPNPALDLSLALVNAGQPSRNVQIYKGGAGAITLPGGNTKDTLTFSGALYAPESTLVVGQKFMTGSLVLNTLTVNGGPNFTFGYDGDLQTYLGNDWTVSRYEEVPASSLVVS